MISCINNTGLSTIITSVSDKVRGGSIKLAFFPMTEALILAFSKLLSPPRQCFFSCTGAANSSRCQSPRQVPGLLDASARADTLNSDHTKKQA